MHSSHGFYYCCRGHASSDLGPSPFSVRHPDSRTIARSIWRSPLTLALDTDAIILVDKAWVFLIANIRTKDYGLPYASGSGKPPAVRMGQHIGGQVFWVSIRT